MKKVTLWYRRQYLIALFEILKTLKWQEKLCTFYYVRYFTLLMWQSHSMRLPIKSSEMRWNESLINVQVRPLCWVNWNISVFLCTLLYHVLRLKYVRLVCVHLSEYVWIFVQTVECKCVRAFDFGISWRKRRKRIAKKEVN